VFRHAENSLNIDEANDVGCQQTQTEMNRTLIIRDFNEQKD
jgi:hypothetical protein